MQPRSAGTALILLVGALLAWDMAGVRLHQQFEDAHARLRWRWFACFFFFFISVDFNISFFRLTSFGHHL
jgi:hypothetical protein